MRRRSLAEHVGAPAAHLGRRVGVEQTYLTVREGRPADLQALLAGVCGDALTVHPSDPGTRRLPSGLSCRSDQTGVELATPPLPLGPGAPAALAGLLHRERAGLEHRLRDVDHTIALIGTRTEISVSVRDDLLLPVAGEFARRCAIAVLMMLGSPDSEGIQIRPRRGRLEVVGDHVAGQDLAAATTLIAACAVMLEEGRWLPETLPREVGLRLGRSAEVFGHQIDACATGTDLRVRGRSTPVLLGTDEATVQDHLVHVWDRARPWAVRLGLDPEPVDQLVEGSVPLPFERGERPAPRVVRDVPAAAEPRPLDSIPRTVADRITVAPAWLTWDTVAWSCTNEDGRAVYAVMPADREVRFLELLDAGELDEVLVTEIQRSFRRRALVSRDQADQPGLWHRVDPSGLLPVERDAIGRIPLDGHRPRELPTTSSSPTHGRGAPASRRPRSRLTSGRV